MAAQWPGPKILILFSPRLCFSAVYFNDSKIVSAAARGSGAA
jgi:hypothetical protein